MTTLYRPQRDDGILPVLSKPAKLHKRPSLGEVTYKSKNKGLAQPPVGLLRNAWADDGCCAPQSSPKPLRDTSQTKYRCINNKDTAEDFPQDSGLQYQDPQRPVYNIYYQRTDFETENSTGEGLGTMLKAITQQKCHKEFCCDQVVRHSQYKEYSNSKLPPRPVLTSTQPANQLGQLFVKGKSTGITSCLKPSNTFLVDQNIPYYEWTTKPWNELSIRHSSLWLPDDYSRQLNDSGYLLSTVLSKERKPTDFASGDQNAHHYVIKDLQYLMSPVCNAKASDESNSNVKEWSNIKTLSKDGHENTPAYTQVENPDKKVDQCTSLSSKRSSEQTKPDQKSSCLNACKISSSESESVRRPQGSCKAESNPRSTCHRHTGRQNLQGYSTVLNDHSQLQSEISPLESDPSLKCFQEVYGGLQNSSNERISSNSPEREGKKVQVSMQKSVSLKPLPKQPKQSNFRAFNQIKKHMHNTSEQKTSNLTHTRMPPTEERTSTKKSSRTDRKPQKDGVKVATSFSSQRKLKDINREVSLVGRKKENFSWYQQTSANQVQKNIEKKCLHSYGRSYPKATEGVNASEKELTLSEEKAVRILQWLHDVHKARAPRPKKPKNFI